MWRKSHWVVLALNSDYTNGWRLLGEIPNACQICVYMCVRQYLLESLSCGTHIIGEHCYQLMVGTIRCNWLIAQKHAQCPCLWPCPYSTNSKLSHHSTRSCKKEDRALTSIQTIIAVSYNSIQVRLPTSMGCRSIQLGSGSNAQISAR